MPFGWIHACAACCPEKNTMHFFVSLSAMATRKLRIPFYCLSNNQPLSLAASQRSCVLVYVSLCTPWKHPTPPYTWSSTEEFSHIVLIAPSFDSLYFTSPTLIMGVISTVIRYHKDNDFIRAPLMGSDMYKERCYTTQSNTLSPCDNWSCWIIATEQLKVISYLAKAVWPPPGLQLSYFFLESGSPFLSEAAAGSKLLQWTLNLHRSCEVLIFSLYNLICQLFTGWQSQSCSLVQVINRHEQLSEERSK